MYIKVDMASHQPECNDEEQPTCVICGENVTEFECTECEISFCGKCMKEHSSFKACENHICKSIRRKNATKCNIHNERITFYCQECSCDACAVCIHGDKHREHREKIMSIEALLDKTLKENLPDVLNKVNELEKIKQFLQKCETNTDLMKTEIDTAVKRFQNELGHSEKILRRTVAAFKEEQKLNLQKIETCIAALDDLKGQFNAAVKDAKGPEKEYERALLVKKNFTEQLAVADELLEKQYEELHFTSASSVDNICGMLTRKPKMPENKANYSANTPD